MDDRELVSSRGETADDRVEIALYAALVAEAVVCEEDAHQDRGRRRRQTPSTAHGSSVGVRGTASSAWRSSSARTSAAETPDRAQIDGCISTKSARWPRVRRIVSRA